MEKNLYPYLFCFKHGRHEVGFEIYASDAEDAYARLESLKQTARLMGQTMASIPT